MISYFSRRSRARKVWTAALCAASFVSGHLLLGQDTQPPAPQPEPQAVINQYLTQPRPRLAVTVEPSRATPSSALPDKTGGLKSATVQAISESPIDTAE